MKMDGFARVRLEGKSHDTKMMVDPRKHLGKDTGHINLPKPKTQKQKDEEELILGTFADVVLACRRDPARMEEIYNKNK